MTVLKAFGVSEGENKHYEEAVYSVTLINNIINKNISSQYAHFNLTPGKFNILMVVKHVGKEKGIKQVEISKNLVLTPSNITKLIDKLEKEKLVTRSAPTGDRRVNIVTITERGSKLVDMASAGSTGEFKKMAGNLSPDKLKKLSSLLMEWLNLLQE
jgi:DNA-binding MarR family transcriptional regulator